MSWSRHSESDVGLTQAVQLTSTPAERLRGLLGRTPLQAGQGLWLRPCNSIHTAFMKYTIDAVYLDKHLAVCKYVEALSPWRMSGCWNAHSVVELPVGQVHKLGIALGDQCRWTPV